ncbi:hypothetical protein GOP47_0003912 [Adiantum capillus-veneris]|uniref:Uncharacterized protein n=1 Tax=Adiantum capillus-veneris TaxID=13818 RepID=A0A9D4V6L1_ADICA|nr:hypothetical protein GOP47_0003912 [Adiantum capillus-veneris]
MKASWLNQELKRIWPFVDKAASLLLKTLLEPILEQYKPSVFTSLKFQKFTLGTVAPQFGGVRVVASNIGEIVLEVAIQWDGNPSIILAVEPVMGITLPVQVKDVAFTGTFRLMFKPFINEVPGFGAVVYSLQEIEKFDLKLKIVGGDVTSFPGLEGVIEGTIRAAVEDSMLWPARNIIPIVPGDYRDLELRVMGILEVKVVQAKDLKNKDIIGKSDPFARVFIRRISNRVKKTKTINNDIDPIWNEHFKLEVEDLATQKLTIEVLDDEGLQAAQLIGSAQIDLKNLEPEAFEDIWAPLYKASKKHQSLATTRGEVHLELIYHSLDDDVLLDASATNPNFASIPTASTPLTSVEKVITTKLNGLKQTPYKSLMREGAVIRGILQVTVIRGENLVASDFNQHCDPYVVLRMKKSDARKTTKVIPKNLNPEWNQHFDFMVEDAIHDMLLVDVFDHDTFVEKRLGKCAITLTRVLREGEHDAAVQLLGGQSGQIFLKLNWLPPAPPDLQYI